MGAQSKQPRGRVFFGNVSWKGFSEWITLLRFIEVSMKSKFQTADGPWVAPRDRFGGLSSGPIPRSLPGFVAPIKKAHKIKMAIEDVPPSLNVSLPNQLVGSLSTEDATKHTTFVATRAIALKRMLKSQYQTATYSHQHRYLIPKLSPQFPY